MFRSTTDRIYEGKVVSLTHRPLFTPKKYSWYSFLLEAESIPGPKCDRKDYVDEKFQWHHLEPNQLLKNQYWCWNIITSHMLCSRRQYLWSQYQIQVMWWICTLCVATFVLSILVGNFVHSNARHSLLLHHSSTRQRIIYTARIRSAVHREF